MFEGLEFGLRAALIGIGATLAMDLWAAFLKLCFGFPSLDYRLVGRWIAHFAHGRFAHDSIAKAPPVPGERILGWSAHYAIGIMFAAILLALCGLDWARRPTPGPALAFGLASLAAPFFVMQPGMGAGIAASRMPKPNVARLRSAITHTVFGIGLYAAALLCAQLIRP